VNVGGRGGAVPFLPSQGHWRRMNKNQKDDARNKRKEREKKKERERKEEISNAATMGKHVMCVFLHFMSIEFLSKLQLYSCQIIRHLLITHIAHSIARFLNTLSFSSSSSYFLSRLPRLKCWARQLSLAKIHGSTTMHPLHPLAHWAQRLRQSLTLKEPTRPLLHPPSFLSKSLHQLGGEPRLFNRISLLPRVARPSHTHVSGFALLGSRPRKSQSCSRRRTTRAPEGVLSVMSKVRARVCASA